MIFIYISTFWRENSLHKYAKLPISRLVCARWADITTIQNSLTICFFWGGFLKLSTLVTTSTLTHLSYVDESDTRITINGDKYGTVTRLVVGAGQCLHIDRVCTRLFNP